MWRQPGSVSDSGVIPYAKMGYWEPDCVPKDTDILSAHFFVNRPADEPGFRLDRTEANDRHIFYTMHSYAAEKPHGSRYQSNGKDANSK